MYQETHTSIIYKDKILPRNTHIYNIQTQNTTKKHTHLYKDKIYKAHL